MAVVKRLGLVQCDKNDKPLSEIRILRANTPGEGPEGVVALA